MSIPDAPLPADDDATPNDVAPNQPSGPHRAAHRRSAPVQSGALPYAVGAGGLVLAALIAAPSLVAPSAVKAQRPPPRPAPTTEAPTATDKSITALRDAIDLLERDAGALTQQVRDAERDAVVVELESDTALLMQQIRTARDNRRKAKPRPKLSAPFTPEELAPVASALRLSNNRLVIDRLGRVILPEGATLPDGVAVKSERIDTDRLSVTVRESDTETVVLARACVPYERHCLIEVRTLPLTQLSTAAVASALDTLARPNPGDTKTAIVLTAAPQAPSTSSPWNVIFASLLALGSVVSFFWIRRVSSRGLQPVEQRLWAAASGSPLDQNDGARTPLEHAVRAVEEHMRSLGAQSARQRAEAASRDDVTAALNAATRGDFTARARVDEDDALLPVALAVNQLLSRTDDRFALLRTASSDSDDEALPALRRHLGQLAPLADLLRDVGERLDVLSETEGGPPPAELSRLADQVKRRAEVAGRLIETLGRDAATLSAQTADNAPARAPLFGVVTSQGPLLEVFSEHAFPARDPATAPAPA